MTQHAIYLGSPGRSSGRSYHYRTWSAASPPPESRPMSVCPLRRSQGLCPPRTLSWSSAVLSPYDSDVYLHPPPPELLHEGKKFSSHRMETYWCTGESECWVLAWSHLLPFPGILKTPFQVDFQISAFLAESTGTSSVTFDLWPRRDSHWPLDPGHSCILH